MRRDDILNRVLSDVVAFVFVLSIGGCTYPNRAVKKIVPIFSFTYNNYDGNPQNSPYDEDQYEPDLTDPKRGKKNWMTYLSSRYPHLDMVVYGSGNPTVEYNRPKFERAIGAARELGLKIYLLVTWRGYHENAQYQRNIIGETSPHLAALQDSVTRNLFRSHIAKVCSLYVPDGVIFDVFRFYQRDWGYSDIFIDSFQRYFPCPFDAIWGFENLVRVTDPQNEEYFNEEVYRKWIEYREKVVGELAKEMTDIARNASARVGNYDLKVGMLVITGKQHLREIVHAYGQLNRNHLRRAGVDFLSPMSYSTDPDLSFYETAALGPLGFELWGAISAEDKRYPTRGPDFERMILRQFEVVDRIILYEDNFVDEEERGIIERINGTSHPVEKKGPRILFVYTDSDFRSLEGQYWWTQYYGVVRGCLKNSVPIDFKFLSQILDSSDHVIIDKDRFPVLVFVRPYQFTKEEEHKIDILRDDGFSMVVFNPNDYFLLKFSDSRGSLEKKFVSVSHSAPSSLGELIRSRQGERLRIAKDHRANYVQYFKGIHKNWNTDLNVEVRGKKFGVVVSKDFGKRREVHSGLTPKLMDISTGQYDDITRYMVLWAMKKT